MTLLAFNFCGLDWWHVLLSWLLPFLLGLLAGWAIWARYKKQAEDLEIRVSNLKETITGLEADLDACKHARTELNGDVALLKGQLREKNLEITTLESSLAASKKGGGASSIAAGAAGVVASSLSSTKKKDKEEKKDKAPKKDDKGSDASSIVAGAAGLAASSSASDKKKDKGEKKEKAPQKIAATTGGQKKQDDLKKIEGVGPKIAGLLNADGIVTFGHLAKSSVEHIQKILDDAGSRYRIANPSTWPEQAALARDGKWDDLKKLQDNLKGGKKG